MSKRTLAAVGHVTVAKRGFLAEENCPVRGKNFGHRVVGLCPAMKCCHPPLCEAGWVQAPIWVDIALAVYKTPAIGKVISECRWLTAISGGHMLAAGMVCLLERPIAHFAMCLLGKFRLHGGVTECERGGEREKENKGKGGFTF